MESNGPSFFKISGLYHFSISLCVDSLLLAVVPVPLAHLVESHTDLLGYSDLVPERPHRLMVKFPLQYLKLLRRLADSGPFMAWAGSVFTDLLWFYGTLNHCAWDAH